MDFSIQITGNKDGLRITSSKLSRIEVHEVLKAATEWTIPSLEVLIVDEAKHIIQNAGKKGSGPS